MWCNIELDAKQFQILEKKQWKEKALSKPKLGAYNQYKEQRGEEKYALTGMSRRERSLLAQFRFGILPLEIGVGRFRNKPMGERKCPFCAEVEDEIHFLFNCEMCDELRRDILGFGPNGGNSNAEVVVFLQEMFKTSPRKLARCIEKSYDLRSSCIRK